MEKVESGGNNEGDKWWREQQGRLHQDQPASGSTKKEPEEQEMGKEQISTAAFLFRHVSFAAAYYQLHPTGCRKSPE